jgi:hypothetical protein
MPILDSMFLHSQSAWKLTGHLIIRLLKQEQKKKNNKNFLLLICDRIKEFLLRVFHVIKINCLQLFN